MSWAIFGDLSSRLLVARPAMCNSPISLRRLLSGALRVISPTILQNVTSSCAFNDPPRRMRWGERGPDDLSCEADRTLDFCTTIAIRQLNDFSQLLYTCCTPNEYGQRPCSFSRPIAAHATADSRSRVSLLRFEPNDTDLQLQESSAAFDSRVPVHMS